MSNERATADTVADLRDLAKRGGMKIWLLVEAADTLDRLAAELAQANEKLKRVNAERGEVYQARTGNSENGLPLWQHTCGAVEAFLSTELAEIKGGCDACESGSDNPEEWQELYRGPVYGRWTREDIEQAKAAAAARWGRMSEFIEPVDAAAGASHEQ